MPPYRFPKVLFALLAAALAVGCRTPPGGTSPAITFTRVPQADAGGRGKNDIIEGMTTGARRDQRLVLYARIGKWWLQPLPDHPFTKIEASSHWVNATHLGTEYAALLVNPEYRPELSMDTLPPVGGAVAALTSVPGQKVSPSVMLQFSGYEWRVRNAPSRRGGKVYPYETKNAWTDSGGALHLRVSKKRDGWSCAEVSLSRSLGYGTYSFTVRDLSKMEPATVFGMFTWDYAASDKNNREMDLEISRWGDPDNKNAQYVIQPFHVPANVARFSVPGGVLTHSFVWQPGSLSFKTVRGTSANSGTVVSHHTFTSDIPTAGIESVRMNVYPYGLSKVHLKNEAEVVIDKFEFLP